MHRGRKATLELRDEFGDVYPFDLNVPYNPAAAEAASASLVTTYRTQKRQLRKGSRRLYDKAGRSRAWRSLSP
jgi:hypothetical protein